MVKLATRFADKPTPSIPGGGGDCSETQAAYRFFEQSSGQKRALGWQGILAPHVACTEARVRQYLVLLCLHSTYVVMPDCAPLGVKDAWMWAREVKGEGGQCPGILESRRWVEGYQRVAETAQEMSSNRLIYVADREVDFLELMQCAHQLGTPADWLIRSQHNRSLPDCGKLWASVLAGAPLGEVEFTLVAR